MNTNVMKPMGHSHMINRTLFDRNKNKVNRIGNQFSYVQELK